MPEETPKPSRILLASWWKYILFLIVVVAACCLLILSPIGYSSVRAPALQLSSGQSPVQTTQTIDVSTSTPERVLNHLTVADAVPSQGKFLAADLVAMKLYEYQDGKEVAEYPILTKGRPGTPFETPSGFYQVLAKEENHLSTIGHVYMPYSMQFYGNYFIHGWPYYPDGTPVATSYSGGCIRLSTVDAGQVFAFADKGTRLFVYDVPDVTASSPLTLGTIPAPNISAQSYLVADIDTGDVYMDKNPNTQWPIASVTKLMTALVANETINYEQHIPITDGELEYPQVPDEKGSESVEVGTLFYPLLMESNNAVADTLSHYYGVHGFVAWMNSTARSLDMASTTYADASGISPQNISTVDDLYRLAVYFAHKKSFVLKISRTPQYSLTTDKGTVFPLKNFNLFSGDAGFVGGKVGQTAAAGDTMVSVFSVGTSTAPHRVAIIVLQSKDYKADTESLRSWVEDSVAQGTLLSNAACATCGQTRSKRIIQL